MFYILFRYKVIDFARWQATYAAHAPQRMQTGERDIRYFRDADDPNMITVLEGWEGLDTAQLYVQSDDTRRMLQAAGVVGEPDIFFLTEIAQ